MVGDREMVWLGEREEEMARESDEKGGSKEGGRKRGKDRVRDEGERKRRGRGGGRRMASIVEEWGMKNMQSLSSSTPSPYLFVDRSNQSSP